MPRKKEDTRPPDENDPWDAGEPEEAEAVEPEEADIESALDEDAEEIPKEEEGGGDDFRLPVPRAGGRGASDAMHLYLREISRFPILEPEEEFELARRVRDQNDSDAAFRLISSHLRLVVKIAMDFQRRWMQNVLDLIQEGNVGLMRAVQKFDPEKGIKFSYYAAFWIKAYILKFIMDNWRLVKIGTTQTQRKLFYNLNKERQRLMSLGYDPTNSALSKSLGVDASAISEMDQRLARSDMSLDVSIGEDSSTTRLDFLPALDQGIEEKLADREISNLLQEHIGSIIDSLNEKEKIILEHRLLTDSPMTLREIGENYGITRERVRQIESRLLEKLRAHLTAKIEDFSPEWLRKNE